MQYHISLHSIAGEEWGRRNVGEVTSNSQDPGKIVEGSQTSLSKLINEMHGLKTFENIFYQNIRFIAYKYINPFWKTEFEIPLKSQGINKYFYENWYNPNPQTLRTFWFS